MAQRLMKIIFSKKFQKQYKKLEQKKQILVKNSLLIFEKNPLDKKLRNHALSGKFNDIRSIDVSFDLRILLQEKDDYALVVMLQVGSHSELYG